MEVEFVIENRLDIVNLGEEGIGQLEMGGRRRHCSGGWIQEKLPSARAD